MIISNLSPHRHRHGVQRRRHGSCGSEITLTLFDFSSISISMAPDTSSVAVRLRHNHCPHLGSSHGPVRLPPSGQIRLELLPLTTHRHRHGVQRRRHGSRGSPGDFPQTDDRQGWLLSSSSHGRYRFLRGRFVDIVSGASVHVDWYH